MKFALAGLLFIILVFIGLRIFSFFGEEADLNKNLSDVEGRLAAAQTQEANLQEETQYLQNPANLEKELRAEFNFKKPGESMIIIVPATSTATSTP